MQLKTLSTFDSVATARIVQQLLVDQGVQASIVNESADSTWGFAGNDMTAVRIVVPERQWSRAREIVKSLNSSEGNSVWRCVRCDELIDGNFGVCWKCGGDMSEVADPNFNPQIKESYAQRSEPAGTDVEQFDRWTVPEGEKAAPIDQPGNPYASSSSHIEPASKYQAAATAHQEVDEETAERLAEEATRAWRAAIFGVFVFPVFLSFYSVFLLLMLLPDYRHLDPQGRRRVWIACILNAFAIIFGWILFRMFVIGM